MVLHVTSVQRPADTACYDTERRCGTSESRKGELEEDELRFDSGIVSASNLSEEIVSEPDLENRCQAKYSTALDNIKELPKIIEHKLSLNESDVEIELELNMMDSGIDITSKTFSCSTVSTDRYSPRKEKHTAHSKVLKSSEGRSYNLQRIFSQDEYGDTKLHSAILAKNQSLIEKILLFIPYSKFLDIQNYCHQTSLHLSVLTEQPRITRLLILAGVRQDVLDMDGNTALHLACLANDVHCVKALLEPVTLYEEKYIKFSYKPVVSRPSDYIDEYNYDGQTCIHTAAKNNNIRILHKLLMCGADVNIGECKAGNTVLHEAAQWGKYEMVDYLLRHRGIEVNKKNYARLTAFQLSCYFPPIQQLLVRNGAENTILIYDESSDDSDDDEYSESDTD